MGVQLVDAMEEFYQNMRELLAKPGRGILSVSLDNKLGRMHQDKRNLAANRWKPKKEGGRKLTRAADC
jgi:hypothetical protein